MDLSDPLNRALDHHRAGRLREAETDYRQILSTQPRHAGALHLSGLLANQTGRQGEAIDLIRKAIEIEPTNANYHCDLGVVLVGAGLVDQAVVAYRQALVYAPNWALVHNNLGLAFMQQGDFEHAVSSFARATALQPDSAAFHFNFGNPLLRLGRFEEAAVTFGRAVALAPRYFEAHNNLGNALFRLGRLEDAAAAFRAALAVQPNFVDALNNLGNVLLGLGRPEEAITATQAAVALSPDFVEGQVNLANALAAVGRFDEAIATYHQALARRPNWPEVQSNLSNALRSSGDLQSAIAAAQEALKLRPGDPMALKSLAAAHYARGDMDQADAILRELASSHPRDADAQNNLAGVQRSMGHMGQAITSYDRACQLDPDNPVFASNRLFALQFSPDYDSAALLREHRAFDHKFAAPLAPPLWQHPNQPSPNRRTRIGYVSGDFRVHCQALFTEALLPHHDHERFEIFCYSSALKADAVTARIKRYADVWRDVGFMNDAALADLIRGDGIDILVDLTMHMAHSRPLLFARRAAAVQVAWLAYPGTTGLSAMDYRLTDPYLDPPGTNDQHYSEQSIRLPDTFWCYDPSGMETERSSAAQPLPDPGPLPALQNGYVTFGCLNDFAKVNPATLALWSRALNRVSGSRLLLLAPVGACRRETLQTLEHLGVESNRVGFVERQPRRAYLQIFQRIDICLDTLPYNGHTTSLDSFWMGVPVITLIGRTVVGRAGWSQLSNLGLTELGVPTEQQFVKIAADLPGDLPRLAEMRRSLRQRMLASPLTDARRFARNIEAAFRSMWGRWCDAPAATSTDKRSSA